MATTSARALRILSVLSTGVTVTAEQLAERSGVGARTVRRDVVTLRELGYEIEAVTGAGGGYRLGGGSRLPPMVFDEDQVVAIAVALQTAPSVLAGIEQSRERALRTVRQAMPERLRFESDAFSVTLVPNYWEFPAAPIDAAVVRDVGSAVRRRHVLRAEYSPGGAEPERLRVEPHRMVVWAARWYLLAYDLDRGEWRALRIDRMTAKPPTYVPFDDRSLPFDSAEAFIRRAVDRGDTLAGWPCQGSAVLEVPPEVAAEFAPGGAVVEPVEGGRCRLLMGAWSWIGLAGLFITFGSRLSEVEPAALREAFGRVQGITAAITQEGAGIPDAL